LRQSLTEGKVLAWALGELDHEVIWRYAGTSDDPRQWHRPLVIGRVFARMMPFISHWNIGASMRVGVPNSRQLPKHRHIWSLPPCTGPDRREDTPIQRG